MSVKSSIVIFNLSNAVVNGALSMGRCQWGVVIVEKEL